MVTGYCLDTVISTAGSGAMSYYRSCRVLNYHSASALSVTYIAKE